MSTTFWIEDGPTVQVRDFDWDGEPAFEDDGVTPRWRYVGTRRHVV